MTFSPEEIRQRRNARLRAARQADPERFARYEREKYERHREKMNVAARARKVRWRAKNPDKAREQARIWSKRRSAVASRAMAERYRTDPMHNLIVRLRVRTRKALKGISKSQATRELIGCDTEQLRAWIAAKFLPGMGWDNMAEWEIDHVWPLILFDLADPRQLRVACHYTNLQPLFRRENRQKKDRLSPAQRAAFDTWRASL